MRYLLTFQFQCSSFHLKRNSKWKFGSPDFRITYSTETKTISHIGSKYNQHQNRILEYLPKHCINCSAFNCHQYIQVNWHFNYLDTNPVRWKACRYNRIILSSIHPNDGYLMVSICHPCGRCYVRLPANSIKLSVRA